MGYAVSGWRRTGIAHERLSFLKGKRHSKFRFTAHAMFRIKCACCLLMMMVVFQVRAQENPKKPMKGVGCMYKLGVTYYVDFLYRPIRWVEFHILNGYSKSSPQLANMSNSEVWGWYTGAGLSLLTAPMRCNYNEKKIVNGSFKVGVSVIGGKVWMKTEKYFPGDAYSSKTIGYALNNEWFGGFEWIIVGYELNFDETIKLGLYPIMACDGTRPVADIFELEFLPGLGHMFQISPGFSLHFIWR